MSEGIPVDLVGAAIRNIVKGEANFEIAVRPGFEIIGIRGRDTVVRCDGHSCALDEISSELSNEILGAIGKHKEEIEELGASKYLDPKANPMIKVDPWE